jgi:hypothetical protein
MSKRNKKLKKQAELANRPVGPMAVAGRWPLYEVLLAPTWRDTTKLASVWVARCAPESTKFAVAYMLVDLGCLGVKSAIVRRFSSLDGYAEFREQAMVTQEMKPADLDLVAKILYTAVDYAASLGFQPDYVFNQAEHLLSGAQPELCPTPVPVGGPEGKPLYVNGPYDDVDRIIATLRRTVGDGNFDYLIQLAPDDFDDDF